MTYEFRPAGDGGWLAIAAGKRLLAVPGLDDVVTAWNALMGADGFQAAVDLLTSGGLAATPPFALVEWEAGADARLIIRGDVTVTVTDDGGEQQLTAAGVSTWVERILTGVTAIAVTVPGATPVGERVLPLALGAALVAAVSTAGASDGSVAADAAPQPLDEATVVVDVDESGQAQPEPADDRGYDYLFGDTVYRSVSEAAVIVPDPDSDSDPELPGDHDGQTVLTSDLARARGARTSRTATPKAAAAPATQFVLVPSTTGAREPLAGTVVIGRSPSANKVSGGIIPKLLMLGNGDQDISRNHAQVSVEGNTAVVTDLHSKNGTTIILPGKDAQRLRPGEPTTIIAGTVIDLGGGITLTLDED